MTTYPHVNGVESTTGTTVSYSYNTANPDRLTRVGSNSIAYNSMGCIASYNSRNYHWERGKLAGYTRGSMSQPGSPYENCTYTYNALGQRVSKTFTYDPNPAVSNDASYTYTTTYTYDNSGRLIREYTTETHNINGASTREFIYLYDEVGMIGCVYTAGGASSSTYFYVRNLQGDVVGIYDSSGNKIAEYDYDAFGNCTTVYGLASSIGKYNPIRYRGYYCDIETNWYFLNARYYAPELRRFISPDDTAYLDPESVNGLNLYCYCGNDPVNYADPSGHFPFFLLAAFLAVGITAAVDYIPDQEFNLHWGWYVGSLLGGAAIGAGIAGLLAGAFGASIGSVAAGAGYTYQILQAVGATAAGAMMLDNLQNAFHYTTHIFWSGGELSQNAGTYLAQNIQGITLEMTKLGQYLSKLPKFNEDAWAVASANFANQVRSGSTVFVIQNTYGVRIDSVWATVEYDILAKKIAELIYVILTGEIYG